MLTPLPNEVWILSERLYLHIYGVEGFSDLLGTLDLGYRNPVLKEWSITKSRYTFMSQENCAFAHYMSAKPPDKQLSFLRHIIFDDAIAATRKDEWNYYGEHISTWYPKVIQCLQGAGIEIDFIKRELNRHITLQEQIAALTLFNEKAQRLRELTFAKTLSQISPGIKISWSESAGLNAERRGPDQEAIEAFALNIRFFTAKRERSSFRNLASIYPRLNIPRNLKDRFESIRSGLNSYLDSPSTIAINDRLMTFRHLFDLVLFGALAHADEKQKPVFDALTASPALNAWLFMEFTNCGRTYLTYINLLTELNHEVLLKLAAVGIACHH